MILITSEDSYKSEPKSEDKIFCMYEPQHPPMPVDFVSGYPLDKILGKQLFI